MNNKLRFALKRIMLDVSDGVSNAVENISKNKRYTNFINGANEDGEDLKDKIINSHAGQVISEKLTDLYAFIENKGMIPHDDDGDGAIENETLEDCPEEDKK